MSKTEHWKGKLKKLTLPEKCNTWKLQVEYLQLHGYEFEDLELENGYFYTSSEVGRLIKCNNKWYEIMEIEKIDCNSDIYHIHFNKESNDYNFEVKFYNGRASFAEMIEDSIKKLKGEK